MFKRKVYTTRGEKVVDFIIGIGLVIVINTILGVLFWGLSYLSSNLSTSGTAINLLGIVGIVLNCLPYVINIGLMVFFGFTRPWIALGMLATVGALLALSLCLAVAVAVWCFAMLGGFGGGGI